MDIFGHFYLNPLWGYFFNSRSSEKEYRCKDGEGGPEARAEGLDEKQ